MRINGFLGELVELPLLMNEFSYNFALFGEPSETKPWGWQLFGHHAALNCLVAGTQLVISPVFMGAEPDVIDAGPYQGRGGVQGAHRPGAAADGCVAFGVARRDATVYASMVDPAMPEGRLHAGDERHLGGCFQDNRVIPYEGILVAAMPTEARAILDAVVDGLHRVPARRAAGRPAPRNHASATARASSAGSAAGRVRRRSTSGCRARW